MYDCGCDECNAKAGQLNLALDDKFKGLLKTGEKAFKRLHGKGSYSPKDLQTEKAYKDLMNQTFEAFNFAITDNDMPEMMRTALQEDARLFGGLKTHSQLFEASKLLLDDSGNLKPFAQLSHEFDKLNVTYNKNYLEAEYEFAVGSAQMAAQWEEFSDNDRYELQYRTAGDGAVRPEHAVLNGITLPKSDPFWLKYMPLNGWRCRCKALEVLKGKFPTSDSEKSIAAGEKATTQIGKDGKNRLEIFRFNPGSQKVVFPPAHPYTKVAGAKVVAKELKANKFIPTGIDDYVKKTGVKVNKDIFSFLNKETPFYTVSPDNVGSAGAFFHSEKNYVVIPVDKVRLRSKWKAESVVYHEFGHAADWHHNLKENKAVTGLMKKYRTVLSKDNGYSVAERKAYDLGYKSTLEEDWDTVSKCGALSDTIMSLNSNYGQGHSKSYFKIKGRSEAEFLAHAFENKFAGNDVFKKILPELYDDTIKLIEELKTKLK